MGFVENSLYTAETRFQGCRTGERGLPTVMLQAGRKKDLQEDADVRDGTEDTEVETYRRVKTIRSC